MKTCSFMCLLTHFWDLLGQKWKDSELKWPEHSAKLCMLKDQSLFVGEGQGACKYLHHLIIMKTPFTKTHWAAQLHGLCTNQFNRKHIGNISNSSCKSFLVQVPADFRYFPLETIPEILLHKGTSGWCPPKSLANYGTPPCKDDSPI